MAGPSQRALIVQPNAAVTARACRNLRTVLARNEIELRKPEPRFRWSDFFDDLGEGSDTAESRPIEMGRRSFPILTNESRDEATATMPGTVAIAVVAGVAAAILFGSLIWMPDMRAQWAMADLPPTSAPSDKNSNRTQMASLSLEEPSRLALYAPLEELMLSDVPPIPYRVIAEQTGEPAPFAATPDEESDLPATASPGDGQTAPTMPATTPPVRKSPPRVADTTTNKDQRARPKAPASAGQTVASSSAGHTRQATPTQHKTAAASQELKGPSIFNPLAMLLGGPFEPSPPVQDR
jgi:hypothetical protein